MPQKKILPLTLSLTYLFFIPFSAPVPHNLGVVNSSLVSTGDGVVGMGVVLKAFEGPGVGLHREAHTSGVLPSTPEGVDV